MTRTDRIARAISEEIARRLDDEPVFIVQRGLSNATRAWQHSRGSARVAVDRWVAMLSDFDVPAIRSMLLSDSEDAREMRNSSLFSGVIPESERMEIIRRAA